MIIDTKKFTCMSFLLCMNFSFVIGMSQLHSTMMGKCLEVLLLLLGMIFFVLHFWRKEKITLSYFLIVVVLALIGMVTFKTSGGLTLLKMILFFMIVKDVDKHSVLKYFYLSLLLPMSFVAISAFIGITNLHYTGAKMAVCFGMQNPNTVPVIVFAVIIAINLQYEQKFDLKMLVIEGIISWMLFYFCRSRTAGMVLVCYLLALFVLNLSKSPQIIKPFLYLLQYMFPLCMIFSIIIAVKFKSRTATWLKINNVLSGRPLAWNRYLTKYGVSFWGQRIDFEMGGLDNAYMRILIQYGILVLIIYLALFLFISIFAYKNNRMILLISVIAYEIYFLGEFGPILVNFCTVSMFTACLIVNRDDTY